MADDDGQDKRHEPGDKKWREAAEKGQIPRSADLGGAAVLLGATGALLLGGGPIVAAIRRFAVPSFSADPTPITHDSALVLGGQLLQAVAGAIALPLGAALVAGLLAGLAQSQGRLATKALEPDWQRLDAIKGFKQHYMSWTPLVELAKGVAKLLLLAVVSYYALRERVAELPAFAALTPAQLLAEMVDLAWRMVAYALPLVVVIGAGDYAWSWWRLHEQLKRSDQELRDDQKQQDGDPHMRARRQQIGRQIASGSMLAAIRDAEVVITNPTHVAIALKYERGADAAPVVLARGLDHLALRIRAEALRVGVPRVENRPLARALYKRVKVGHPIPEDLYGPVAKVLAVIYRRRAQKTSF